jgi:hypothetical protein
MTLQATVRFGVNGLNAAAGQLGTKSQLIALASNLDFTDGSGAGQANKIYVRGSAGTGTQAQSVNTDIDLSGSLTDDLGNSVVFTQIKAIIVAVPATNPGTLTVGPAASNGFTGPFSGTTPAIVLPATEAARFAVARYGATGWTVTAGTGDLLRIASAATAGTYLYDLVIIGT